MLLKSGMNITEEALSVTVARVSRITKWLAKFSETDLPKRGTNKVLKGFRWECFWVLSVLFDQHENAAYAS